MTDESIVIVAAKRTPIGAFQGVLAGASATDLGAAAIAGAMAARSPNRQSGAMVVDFIRAS